MADPQRCASLQTHSDLIPIDPFQYASKIIASNPELAGPLLDLLIWAATEPDVLNSSAYDAIEELGYAKTERSVKARLAFRRERQAAVAA